MAQPLAGGSHRSLARGVLWAIPLVVVLLLVNSQESFVANFNEQSQDLYGTQNAYQLSLVWTPTDYTRFLVNYGRMDYTDAVHPAAGGERNYSVDAVGIRAQADF